jgi:putative photosynthetic complex assembly protein
MSVPSTQGYLPPQGSNPMRGHLPRWPAYVLVGIIGLTLIQAMTSRLTGRGTSRVPDAAVERVLPLRFFDEKDGAVRIVRATDERQIERVSPGTNGFIRSVMRGLVHERRQHGGTDTTPFLLQQRVDGRLILEDPVSGRRLSLNSFGALNTQAFGRLFAVSDGVKP